MTGRLDGRAVMITGAGQGIGRGLALRFAREGARIVVAERNRETGERTAAEVADLGADVRFVGTDVSDKQSVQGAVQATVDAFGRIDVLVNNAWAGAPAARIEWFEDSAMEHAWRVGFLSVLWAMQAAFPHMKAQRGGRVINMCSLNGVNAHMFTVHYNTAKEAVRTLTRTAAVEWGRHQITCNVICPAAATEAYVAFRDANPETAQEMLKQNPLGRMGDPEDDIGGAALFLATDDSKYVTGNTLFVDGGGHINGVDWRPDMPEELPR